MLKRITCNVLKYWSVLTFILVLAVMTESAKAQYPYAESFRGATAPGMVFGGGASTPAIKAFLTANADSALVSPSRTNPPPPQTDPNGSGYLRLTRNVADQRGFARNTTAFSSSNGLDISFEYFTYGGSSGSADGITFFLFNSSLAGSFLPGGFGGSLGYAQNTTQGLNGLVGGYIGIGFDEFGNFSTNTQGRVGGPGQFPNSVTLRGDGDGTQSTIQSPSGVANSNYEYLTHIQTTTLTVSAFTWGFAKSTYCSRGFPGI